MKRLVPALAVLLLLTTPAAGQSEAEQILLRLQLAKVETIEVGVTDNVIDGCLPQPNALKVEAELILRRSGIKVARGHTLDISATGFAISGGCTASLRVALWRFETLADGTNGLVESSSMGSTHSGPKGGFQQQLREAVNAAVTALANEILKARGR